MSKIFELASKQGVNSPLTGILLAGQESVPNHNRPIELKYPVSTWNPTSSMSWMAVLDAYACNYCDLDPSPAMSMKR